jgi:tetratricopeptide (TPR) repeat protein
MFKYIFFFIGCVASVLVSAQSPTYRQTLPNNTASKLTAPSEVLVDAQNHVFVIDKKLNAIIHFDDMGNEVEIIQSIKTSRGTFELKEPAYLARHAKGLMIYDAKLQHIFLWGGDKGEVWGTPGGARGQLDNVTDMASDSQGYLYVLQRKRNQIEIFNAQGDFVTWIAPSKGGFQNATAIEVSNADELYVLDQDIHSLFVYNIDGRVINTHRSIHKKQGVILSKINAFALLLDGSFLLLDDDSGDVLVLDRDGLLRTTIQVSSDEAAFKRPIAIATSGSVTPRMAVTFQDQRSVRMFDLVTYKSSIATKEKRLMMFPLTQGPWAIRVKDVNNKGWSAMILADQPNTVVVVDASGKEIWALKSGLEEPVDVDIDDEGIVHIVDRGAGVIKVYDAQGVLMRTMGKEKNAKLKQPSALVRLPNQNVVVCDQKSGDLLEWSKDGVFTKVWLEGERSHIQEPVQLGVDSKGQIFIWDKAQNAILRTSVSGWPMSIKKLQVYKDESTIGEIAGFQLDAFNQLLVFNASTSQIEMYEWDLEPVRFCSVGHAEEGVYGLKGMEYLAYDEYNSALVLGDKDGKASKSFFYSEVPNAPNFKVRWDIDDSEKMSIFFEVPEGQRKSDYGLLRNDDATMKPIMQSTEPKLMINTGEFGNETPVVYHLVALNHALVSDPGTKVIDYFGWANFLEKQGLWERALLAYRSAHESCDKSQRLEQWMVSKLIAISQKLIAKNEPNLAMAYLNLAQELAPRDTRIDEMYCRAYQLNFKLAMEFQHLDELINQMEQAIGNPKLKSAVTCAVDSLCWTLLKSGFKWDVNNAILIQKRWSQLSGQSMADGLTAHLYLEAYRLEKNDLFRSAETQVLLNEAEKWVESARSTSAGKPNEPSVMLTQLKIYNAQGRFDQTEKLALAEIATPSKNWTAEQNIVLHEMLADAYVGQNKHALALLECENLLVLNPNSKSVKLTKAEMLKTTGKVDEALKILEEELVKSPEQALLIMRVGEIYEAKEDWDKATFQFEKAIRIEPENKSFYRALARTLAKQGQFLKAAECGRIAFDHELELYLHAKSVGMSSAVVTKLGSEWLEGGLLLASDALRAQKLDWALEALDELKERLPYQPAVHFLMGQTLLNKGWQYEAAIAFYTACKIDPDNKEYLDAHKGMVDLIEQSAKSKSPVAFTEVQTNYLYPALYRNYSNKQLLPLGQVIVTNNTNIPITPTAVTVYIPEFMTQPTSVANPVLMAYSDTPIALHALIGEKVLNNTTSRETNVEIEVRYFHNGSEKSMKENATITIMGRNAINWNDKLALGAFVTSGHPELVNINRTCDQFLSNPSSHGLPSSIVKASQFFAAFENWEGLHYSADPNTPFAKASTNKVFIDYLQFPTELLLSRAGDCDDFVALFCALMESAGIRTGFIDMPGHVMSAFETEVKPDQLNQFGISPNEVILKDDRVWIPVEATLFGKLDFLEAWKAGSARYNNAIQLGQFPELVTMTVAHNSYLPANGIPGEKPVSFEISNVAIKRLDNVLFKVSAKMKREQLLDLEQRYLKEPDNVFVKNRYAMILARTGALDRAQTVLDEALALSPKNAVVLNNMGNVAYLNRSYNAALEKYRQAMQLDDTDAQILINICQTLLALDKRAEAKTFYEQAALKDANVIQLYPHLKTKLQ